MELWNRAGKVMANISRLPFVPIAGQHGMVPLLRLCVRDVQMNQSLN